MPGPVGAPSEEHVSLICPLPDDLGESLKIFMDRLIRCDRPELRVDPEHPDNFEVAPDDADDSPLFQALITYVPASSLQG
jgi:hypothetical protein